MDDLELAKQYLKRRAISTAKSKDKFLLQQVEVVEIRDVIAVIEMVQNKTFNDFYNKMKKLGHPHCP